MGLVRIMGQNTNKKRWILLSYFCLYSIGKQKIIIREITKELCENINTALFVYVFEKGITLNEVKAVDFRNWCYEKEKENKEVY